MSAHLKIPQRSSQKIFNTLLPHCLNVQLNAYCPYSKFHVGCALMATDPNASSSSQTANTANNSSVSTTPINGPHSRIFTGCNFENQSFGVTICAERCAIGSMLAQLGPSAQIDYLVVATPNGCACCGACLQVISEFVSSPEVPVILLQREVKHQNGIALKGENQQSNEYIIKEELQFKDLLPFAINIKGNVGNGEEKSV